ncbi:MAG TPA: hypothetical protein VHY19_02495 [Steroidobacteraceae bacterium]|nr:hypothetical protein [Steroidobacteraceae bacterium]
MGGKNLRCICPGLTLLLACGAAQADVSYTVTQRDLTAPVATKAMATAYFAQHDAVRVGGPQASRVILFKSGNIYSIDHGAHTVHVLKQATLDSVRERLQKSAQLAEQKVNSVPNTAPTAQRLIAQRLVEQMKGMTERLLKPATLQFHATDRSETLGRDTCRIWEESENGTKHLEVCVAHIDQVPDGQELFEALGHLCRYYGGSLAALGVGFGFTDPWPAFSSLKGIPIRIRVFEKGRAVSQTDLTDIHASALPASLFTVPPAYKVDSRLLR